MGIAYFDNNWTLLLIIMRILIELFGIDEQ